MRWCVMLFQCLVSQNMISLFKKYYENKYFEEIVLIVSGIPHSTQIVQ